MRGVHELVAFQSPLIRAHDTRACGSRCHSPIWIGRRACIHRAPLPAHRVSPQPEPTAGRRRYRLATTAATISAIFALIAPRAAGSLSRIPLSA